MRNRHAERKKAKVEVKNGRLGCKEKNSCRLSCSTRRLTLSTNRRRIDHDTRTKINPSGYCQEFGKDFLDFLKENPVGKVYFAPVDIYFNNENVYQPDIIFISKDRLHILKEDGVYGAPDLIIEILSPATAYYDLRIKFKVYEQHGVKEYWIVDPELKEIEIYQLQNNKFVFVEKAEKEAKIKSTLLSGLEVGLKDVFV